MTAVFPHNDPHRRPAGSVMTRIDPAEYPPDPDRPGEPMSRDLSRFPATNPPEPLGERGSGGSQDLRTAPSASLVGAMIPLLTDEQIVHLAPRPSLINQINAGVDRQIRPDENAITVVAALRAAGRLADPEHVGARADDDERRALVQQRLREAMAEAFTEPREQRPKIRWRDLADDDDGMQDVPMAARIERAMSVVFTASDGHKSIRFPTVQEAADAVLPVVLELFAVQDPPPEHVCAACGAVTRERMADKGEVAP